MSRVTVFNYLVSTHPVARAQLYIPSVSVSHAVDAVTGVEAPDLQSQGQ